MATEEFIKKSDLDTLETFFYSGLKAVLKGYGVDEDYISLTTDDPVNGSVAGDIGAKKDVDGNIILIEWDGDSWEPAGTIWPQVFDANNNLSPGTMKAVADFIFDITPYVTTKNNVEMIAPADWQASLGAPIFDIEETYAGGMNIQFTSGNQNIILNDVLELSKKYKIYVKLKSIGATNAKVQIGGFTSQGCSNASVFCISPTTTLTEYTGEITAGGTTNLSIGIIEAENDGPEVQIDYCRIKEIASDEAFYSDKISEIESLLYNIIPDEDSGFSVNSDWESSINSPSFDLETTYADGININFTSETQAILLNKPLMTVGEKYFVEARLKTATQTNTTIHVGRFGSTPSLPGTLYIAPSADLASYSGIITAETENIAIGILGVDNDGTDVQLDYIRAYRIAGINEEFNTRIAALEASDANIDTDPLLAFYTEQFLKSISRYDKPLTKIAIVGDSLMANYLGGEIPAGIDEGAGKRPIRLGVNSVPRRIYDHLSWNKPTHRRLDDAGWTLSGIWTTVNGPFEPSHGNELYHRSSESGAYAEIDVPDGQENFALICHRDENTGILNVTINGGDISPYGPSSIDLDRAPDDVNDYGNGFYTVLYTGLPTGGGANTIRVSKEANTEQVNVWGGLYWSGNTLIVHNIAHGGSSLSQLSSQHLNAELAENNFDAILFQLPLMNDIGDGNSITQAAADFEGIYNTYLKGKDVLVMSCNPFGTDPRDGTPNYYGDYLNPTPEEYALGIKRAVFDLGLAYIDVFSVFKQKVENRGGSLEDGDAGLFYTWDGQHPSPNGAGVVDPQDSNGVREWWNVIKTAFINKIFE